EDALRLVEGVLKVKPGAELIILSDGGVPSLGSLVNPDQAVRFVGVGSRQENLGIVGFDVRPSFEKRGEAQAFAEVRNFGAQPATVSLRCLVDGELTQAREATIDPQEKTGFVFSGLAAAEAPRTLRLELAGEDLLAADNAVEGKIEATRALPILIVSN